MNRRLGVSVLAGLVIGASVLSAQTDELKAYLDRARALSKADKVEQALPYFLFALELGETEFGVDSPAVVPILNDLAQLYAARSDYRDAEPLLKRALAIQEQELSRYRSGIARTLTKLGSLYEATERPMEARRLYERVVTALQPALGADHPSVRTARLRLAKLGEGEGPPSVAGPALAAAPLVEPAAAAAPPPYRVHLTSIRDPADSQAEWKRLRRHYPALLEDLDVAVTRVDLGAARGVWYRIQGGPLRQSDARSRCAAFAVRSLWCRVVLPPGNAADRAQRQVALRVRRRGAPGARVTRRPRGARPPGRTTRGPPRAAPEPGARRFAGPG